MNTWIELINEPLKSEIVQLELLSWEVIDSLPFVIVYAIPILFGVMMLLAVLDCLFLEDKDLPQSYQGSKTGEKHPGPSRDSFSQPATRLFQNDTNAAA
ncbi:hypothetical protein ACFL3Q_04200 [Planctomycetota bacterium]